MNSGITETIAIRSVRTVTLPALNLLAAGCEVLTILALAADVAITFTSTVLRYLLHHDLPWAPDVSGIFLAIIAFIGAPAYMRRHYGMACTAVLDRLHGPRRAFLQALGQWSIIFTCALALLRYPQFLQGQSHQVMPVLAIPNSVAAIWLGIGLVLLILFAAERLAALPLPRVILAFAVAVLVSLIAVALREAYADTSFSLDPFWVIAPVVALAFISGTPIPIILVLAGGFYFVATGDAPLVAIPTALQYGAASYILLAIPFFMIAAVLMELTAMAARLVDAVQHWIGHWRGGLLIAEVVATYIFSGISGSKAADMAAIGAVMKGPTRAQGCPAGEFAAVLCASAAMSETVPPSLAMLILGSVTTLSVGALFIAGIVPAMVLAVALIAGVALRARRRDWGSDSRFDLRNAIASLLPAIPALGIPLIVVGGIVGGIASPTESGSFAVMYGIVALLFVIRAIGVQRCYTAIRDAALTAGMILLMVCVANVLAQAVVLDGLGAAIGSSFGAFHSRTAFLFLSVVALMLIGIVLEGFPAILVAAPLFLPTAQQLGVDPLQFGILLVMATGIGVMMPPAGIGFHIACTVSDAPMAPAMRASLFYNVFLLLGLALVIVFPPLTLFLPHAFGLH